VVLASAFCAVAAADPILLGETVTSSAGGTWGGAPVPPTIVGMQFHLGYQYPFAAVSYSNGTYLQVVETNLAKTIGGNKFFAKGQTGVFDFYQTNCPVFQNVVATLTDGQDEQTTFGGFGYNDDRIVTGGGWYSGTESGTWGLQPGHDLAGYTIKFFRLTVSEVDWGTTTNGQFRISGISQWQVYGFAPPIRPELRIYPAPLDTVLLSWPTQYVGFVLQTGMDATSAMTNVSTAPVVAGTNNVVLVARTPSRAFFRLLYAP
jgi:hypothetical protein